MSTTLELSQDTQEMYKLWLSGLSIRKIGAMYGVGRMSVWGRLTRAYGLNACTPSHQSLARICYKEYGDLVLAERARGIEGLFMSGKTEDNYSKHQTKENDFDTMSYNVDGFEPALMWAYFHLLIDIIADAVADVYAGALIDMSMSTAD
jgi:hypothetical protein